jgi:hypothetical protein
VTDVDSQQPKAEDTTPERLAMAKASFGHIEDHVSALELKARTFLTVNSLLVGAGVLSVARGGLVAPIHAGLRFGLVLLTLCLLGTVAAAFRNLFDVLGVREFEGRPRASSTLDSFARDDAATLRESLARYYADAADKNRSVAEGKVKHLKMAIGMTRWAFWSFVCTICMLMVVNALTGEHKMESRPASPNLESTSGSGSEPGSQPKPPTQPAPKPVEGVPLEKVQPPTKPK